MAMSRKRPRTESPRVIDSRPLHASSSHDIFNSVSSLDIASPSPLVNTDYFLSGGMDTPGAYSEQRMERARYIDAEQDYRQNRFSQRPQDVSANSLNRPSIPHTRSTQRSSPTPTTNSISGWQLRSTAWALTGGLAGKIFNFCWNTTFHGFKAGGGATYGMDDEPELTPSKGAFHKDNRDFLRRRASAQVPGSFPLAKKSPDTRGQDLCSSNGTNTRTNLWTHDRHNVPQDSATKNNWVFVEHNQIDPSDQSPARKRSRASVAGQTRSDLLQSPRPYTASFASPRSRTTSATSVQLRPRAPHISPTRKPAPFPTAHSSPLSPELELYQRKKRREARRQDGSLKRLNAQLQDMIREGQQALGSKIEIVDDYQVLDEGYYDDDDDYDHENLR